MHRVGLGEGPCIRENEAIHLDLPSSRSKSSSDDCQRSKPVVKVLSGTVACLAELGHTGFLPSEVALDVSNAIHNPNLQDASELSVLMHAALRGEVAAVQAL